MAAEALVGVHSLGVGWGGGRAAGSGAEPERAAGCGMGTVRDEGLPLAAAGLDSAGEGEEAAYPRGESALPMQNLEGERQKMKRV